MKLKHKDEFFYNENHMFDHYINMGYNYELNIMKNVLSQEMFANPLNDIPMRLIERMIEFLVNLVKRIKLENNFTLPKNSKNLN